MVCIYVFDIKNKVFNSVNGFYASPSDFPTIYASFDFVFSGRSLSNQWVNYNDQDNIDGLA